MTVDRMDELPASRRRRCAWRRAAHRPPRVRKDAPQGLYERRNMTAALRCITMPEESAGSIDRAMRTLGLVGGRRDEAVRDYEAGKGRTSLQTRRSVDDQPTTPRPWRQRLVCVGWVKISAVAPRTLPDSVERISVSVRSRCTVPGWGAHDYFRPLSRQPGSIARGRTVLIGLLEACAPAIRNLRCSQTGPRQR